MRRLGGIVLLLLLGLFAWRALHGAADRGRAARSPEGEDVATGAGSERPVAETEPARQIPSKPAAARTVRARVLSASGPLEGAEVRVANDELRAIAHTDAAGEALVPTDERSVVFVEARKEGFRTAEGAVPGGESEIELVLEPGAPIRGRVVRASDGRPVPDASVRVADRASRDELDREVATDEEGRFLFGGVAPGSAFLVGVRAPGYGPATVSGVADSRATEVVVALGGGASLSGTVRGATGATVWVYPESDRYLERNPDGATFGYRTFRAAAIADCDAEGAYAVAGLVAPETYAVLARGPDGAEARATVAVERAEGSVTLDLALQPTGRILVRAVDPEGRPAGRSRLTIRNAAGDPVLWPTVPVFTGPDGSVAVSPLEPGPYEIVVQPERWGAGRAYVTVAAGIPAEVEIRLSEGVLLEGTVTDPAGNALEGIDVGFYAPGDTESPRQYSTTVTDGRGRFRLEGLLPARGELEVSDWAGRWKDWKDDAAVPGPPVRRIVLAPAAGVRGRLAPAPPARRAACMILEASSTIGPEELVLDADGGFRLHGLPEGEEVTLVFAVPDAAPLRVTVPPLSPGEKRELGMLAVSPGRTLHGRCVDGDGLPLVDTTVQLYQDDLFDRYALTDVQGRFAFEHVAPQANVSITVWTEQSSGPYFEIEDWTAKPVHEIVVERR